MATPTLTKHRLPGALGDLFLDLRAAGRKSPRPAVVVLHGFKGFKDWGMFPPLADHLARAGFVVASFNLSGSGADDSGEFTLLERFACSTFSHDLEDIAVVVDALAGGRLRTAPPSSIGLVGHSRGGGTAIVHAAGDSRIRALATWASISHVNRFPDQRKVWRETGQIVIENARTGQQMPLRVDHLDDVEQHGGPGGRLDILGAAARLAAPWLIAHGTADPTVPIGEAEALAASSSARPTELLRVEGAGHTFGAVHPFKGMTPDLERLFGETISWMGRHLA